MIFFPMCHRGILPAEPRAILDWAGKIYLSPFGGLGCCLFMGVADSLFFLAPVVQQRFFGPCFVMQIGLIHKCYINS